MRLVAAVAELYSLARPKCENAMLNPRTIIRSAAGVAAIAAFVALGLLAYAAYDLGRYHSDLPRFSRELGVYGLFAIVPLMFLWAAFQAWRLHPSGKLSISSCYVAVGLLCFFLPLHDLVFYWGDHTLRNILLLSLSIPLLIVGVLVFAGESTKYGG